MTSNIQQSNFSHAKCLNCGHIGVISNFDSKENSNVTFGQLPEGVTISAPIFICPICGSDSTEALFPNEVN